MEKWAIKNPEKVKRHRKKNWINKNKSYHVNYFKKRKQIDINFKLRCNLASRLNTVIKSNPKYDTTKHFLGCSIVFLKQYLQSKFKEGITWDNYGRKKGIKCWEIDHIKPCCKFNLSKPEEDNKKGGKMTLKIKLVGLPIIKDNATPLSMLIFKNELQETILKTLKAKFPKAHIDNLMKEYLKRKDVLQSLTREYRVQRSDSYKKEGQIQAQISREYFNGDEGVISLIKNEKVGNVGLTAKYCTVKEAIEHNLTIEDLDLEKTYKELEPFTIYISKPPKEVFVKNIETNEESLITEIYYLSNWKKYEIIKPLKKKVKTIDKAKK